MHHSTPVRRLIAGGASLAVAATLAASLGGSAQAVPAAGETSSAPDAREASMARHDNLPNPLARQQAQLRQEALQRVAHGKAEAKPRRGGGSTVVLGKKNGEKQAVEFFDNNKRANVWTVLSEFGDEVTDSGGEAGPRHNQMPEPDRTEDNTTQWTEDFDVAHYDEMFNGEGESFKNYYLNQSNGEYTPTVTTEDWVQVPRNGYYYGDNSHEAEGYWAFVDDTVDAWYDQKVAEGMSDTEIAEYLSTFDKWDRYDFNGNGNFNEADGYIDHFQAIHAGAGEEAGGGALGEYAIWSHRWYADYTTIGSEGPEGNLMGGQEIGNTGMFVGDYTVEPENGGLGVFAHEYAHDLGLPDFYDTAGGENSTAFWTLMSSGSWLGDGEETDPDAFEYGIGGIPNDMGPEEKLFLGWLDTTVVDSGRKARVKLDAAGAERSNDAIQVLLPDAETTTVVGEPYSGERSWYSDAGDGLTNTLSRSVPAAQSVTIDAQAWYDTEKDYDYWYAQYSTDGGASWTTLATMDGESDWAPVTFSYDPAGEASTFRFLYQTDGGVTEPGVMLDEITTTVDGAVVDTDDAESDTSAWETGGWMRTTGTITETAPQYYLIENKSYVNYDRTLETGPYNFSEGFTRPDWVEHFPYQDGMLVWYVNHTYADNNTSAHPGAGYALPVDANPEALRWTDGTVARNRIQAFDATFGFGSTDPITLHRQVSDGNGGFVTQEVSAAAREMQATFDDSDPMRYYDEANPGGSVKVAGVGVTARVVKAKRGQLKIAVSNPKR